MKVELIDYTGAGSPDPARHAAERLVFTKSTRLEMSPGLLADIRDWTDEKLNEELEYMSKTIPSSWEFVNYTFLITGVTRAFTHQFVRTRTGSYAQQTMRVLNVDGWEYATGPTLKKFPQTLSGGVVNPRDWYDKEMSAIAMTYNELVNVGVAIEDARGILPTNILTNIVAGFNLRTVCELVRKRSSSRTQGEYREVLEAMKAEVVRVHPWAQMFVERDLDKAAAALEEMLLDLRYGIGFLPQGSELDRFITNAVKLIDQMRGSA